MRHAAFGTRGLIAVGLILCVMAAAFTAWSTYHAAFYDPHGYSPIRLRDARPTLTFASHNFVMYNYLWLLSSYFPHTDATLHINRIFWVMVGALSFTILVRRLSGNWAAPLLAFVLFLNMPTLTSARLWSFGGIYNMSSTAACLCLLLEWRNFEHGVNWKRRGAAALLYFLSVVFAEHFYFLPLFMALAVIYYEIRRGRTRRQALTAAGALAGAYALPVMVNTYLIFISRGPFAQIGLVGSVGRLVSPAYLTSVVLQFNSNFGYTFFLFLIDNLYEYYAGLSFTQLVYLLLFCAVFTVCFTGLVDAGRRAPVGVPMTLVGIGLTMVTLSALSNAVGVYYMHTLGYGVDRTNQASAVGATMALVGLLMGAIGRGGLARVAGVVCCFVLLFATTKAAALQAQDWERVRQWEVRLGEDYRNYLNREPAAREYEVIVVHGFPRYVSSFGFDPALIWIVYPYPWAAGEDARYWTPVQTTDRRPRSWRQKVEMRLSRGYRFWPLRLAPFHPTAEHLDPARSVKVVYVDEEFPIQCTTKGMRLPLVQDFGKIVPIEVEGALFADWNEQRPVNFERVAGHECRSVAARIAERRGGKAPSH